MPEDLCRSLQQSYAMNAGSSPGARSPSAVLMRSQQWQPSGHSPSQGLHQSPTHRSLQAPMGPWHCPSNVRPDHATQLAQRLLSPHRTDPAQTQPSQEALRRAHLSQGSRQIYCSGPLDMDAPQHLPVIPETQSMDESPLCAGVLEPLATQASGIGAARAARHASVIPRLQCNDGDSGILAPDEGVWLQRRSPSLATSQTASAKAEKRSWGLSPADAQEWRAQEAVISSQHDNKPPRSVPLQHHGVAGRPGRHLGLVPQGKDTTQHGNAECVMAGKHSSCNREGGKRKRQETSAGTSVETEALHTDSRSGGLHAVGHSAFQPPVCSQVPQPIMAMKPGRRRRITPTQIRTGGASWPPSAQAVLRVHHSAVGKSALRLSGEDCKVYLQMLCFGTVHPLPS